MFSKPVTLSEAVSHLSPSHGLLNPETEFGAEKETVGKVSKATTTRFPRLAKASAAVRNFYNETHINYRVRQLAILVAAYPIVNLILTLIAGAALTLTPVNIVLIAAATLFLISLIVSTVNQRNSCLGKGFLATRFVKELFAFAIAPITAPAILFSEGRRIALEHASAPRTRKESSKG